MCLHFETYQELQIFLVQNIVQSLVLRVVAAVSVKTAAIEIVSV